MQDLPRHGVSLRQDVEEALPGGVLQHERPDKVRELRQHLVRPELRIGLHRHEADGLLDPLGSRRSGRQQPGPAALVGVRPNACGVQPLRAVLQRRHQGALGGEEAGVPQRPHHELLAARGAYQAARRLDGLLDQGGTRHLPRRHQPPPVVLAPLGVVLREDALGQGQAGLLHSGRARWPGAMQRDDVWELWHNALLEDGQVEKRPFEGVQRRVDRLPPDSLRLQRLKFGDISEGDGVLYNLHLGRIGARQRVG
mmetsp:Transcript_78877/g.220685  ORF Transcript_78877/g.220685 Transcript_78877/m.220685 type:complete len:254 (+) Transcript_78877:97-858(+)